MQDLYSNIFNHGGNLSSLEKFLNRKILDFSSNINPYTLPYIKNFFQKNTNSIAEIISKYPDPEAKELTQKLAEYWDITPENILCGNGATELIYLVPKALNLKHALILIPTFSEYERALKLINAKISFYLLEESKNFVPDWENLINFLKSQNSIDSIFICNPNNPTGNLILDLEKIQKLLSLNAFAIIDESFMDFLYKEKKYTAIKLTQIYQNLIIIRSFTKFFGIPGLRLGYLISHPKTINKIKNFLMPWNVNGLAQALANYLLEYKIQIDETKKIIAKEKGKFLNYFASSKIFKAFSSVTNFLLIKINTPYINSEALTQKFLKNSILIRDCKNFRGLNNKFFRIAIKTSEENTLFLKILENILEKLQNG